MRAKMTWMGEPMEDLPKEELLEIILAMHENIKRLQEELTQAKIEGFSNLCKAHDYKLKLPR